jgi:hypothetical protein
VILKYLRCFAKICAAGNNSIVSRRTTQFPPTREITYKTYFIVFHIVRWPMTIYNYGPLCRETSRFGNLRRKQLPEGWQIWMFPYTEDRNCFIIFCQCFKMTDDSIRIYLMWGTIEKSVIMANTIHYIYLRLYLLDQ